jgi:hypothetical protein
MLVSAGIKERMQMSVREEQVASEGSSSSKRDSSSKNDV